MEVTGEEFERIVELTPLVSIDLLLRNSEGEYLLGYRKNETAKGSWFDPGGRIKKDERLSEAFKRITADELGTELDFGDAELVGVYEHIYDTNFAEKEGFGTHYVVIAYEVPVSIEVEGLPMDQHSEWRYFSVEDILKDANVHENMKNYFKDKD
ncbi:MAG: GDP-mannose mannosyl hydrolase [Planctomycetota bacterium]|jgi:colanic acid biosynthesis protein WcaH